MEAISLNIPIHEKQTLKLYVTLTSNGAPVDKTAFDVYAASAQGSVSNPFTVAKTDTDGQWLITAPGKQNATSTEWQYQIFAHNKETCHEWPILSGTITQADRLADISCVKYAVPEYAVTVDIITGAMSVKPNYTGEDTPTVDLSGDLTEHTENTDIHVTAVEREKWNAKADRADVTAHTGDTDIHVTAADREAWSEKQFSEAEMPNLKKLAGETCEVSTNLVVNGMQADIMPVALFLGANNQDGHVMCFQGGIFNLTQGTRQLIYSNSTTFVLGDASTQTYLQGKNFTIDVANLGKHLEDTTKHITAAERTAWEKAAQAVENITVDATYNAASANPQAGTAVMGAFTTYLFNVDQTGLSWGSGAKTGNAGSVAIGLSANTAAQIGSIAIGNSAGTTGNTAVAIGFGAKGGYKGVSIGRDCSSAIDAIAISTESKALGEHAISIGRKANANEKNTISLGLEAKSTAAVATSIGTKATVADAGVTCISAWDSTNLTTQTQFYLIGAGSALATTYEGGEACLGYVVKDTSGNILFCGTRKLSELLTNNTAFAPADLEEHTPFMPTGITDPIDLTETETE